MGVHRVARAPQRLQHLHIPGKMDLLPSYALAVAVQSKLQQRLLDYKAAVAAAASSSNDSSQPLPPPPPPTIISFTPAPTYTLGRRQTEPLSPAEEERLRARLNIHWYKQNRKGQGKPPKEDAKPRIVDGQLVENGEHHYSGYYPAIHTTPRGGLTTYHGPGQVVFWPVIDLKSPLHRHFSVRDYACLLEKTTIASIAATVAASLPSLNPTAVRQRDVQGFTTENPGVWVRRHRVDGVDVDDHEGEGEEERKIAALGVHLRRHVTGLGVAVNCSMPCRGPEAVEPWRRIVACGLEGKRVTSLACEMLDFGAPAQWAWATRPRLLLPYLRPSGYHQSRTHKTPSWAKAPLLEAEMLRVWPALFARSLGLLAPAEAAAADHDGDAGTTVTEKQLKKAGLVKNVTLEMVFGRAGRAPSAFLKRSSTPGTTKQRVLAKGWKSTNGLPEEEQ
ncbi:hypothetical protein PG994_008336 [Apiospora phragmitis]|uniref:BPL/LPL catalytic domain-containing protein n=1 Tax=Apiospora phragmitis TaxID=2905665 RepID=A0ABR1UV88_9PEZI